MKLACSTVSWHDMVCGGNEISYNAGQLSFMVQAHDSDKG